MPPRSRTLFTKRALWSIVALFAVCVALVTITVIVATGSKDSLYDNPNPSTISARPGPGVIDGPGSHISPTDTPKADINHLRYASSHVLGRRTGHHEMGRGSLSPTPSELLQNTLAFGIPALLIFILRMANCFWVLRKIHIDDWIMIPTFGAFICLLTLINVSANYGTNLYPPELEDAILSDPLEISNRIAGSKLVVALEQCMLFNSWGVKICIWCFLHRLSRQLPKFLFALKLLLGFMVTAFVVLELLYYSYFCQPFSQYWAVPVKNDQCSKYGKYSAAQMSLNISTDLALVAIPCYMLWISRLSWKRKLILGVIFSLAVFTIIAAILNKAFNFANPLTTSYQIWYIREAGVAQLVGNLICCYKILQKIFRFGFSEDSNGPVLPRQNAVNGGPMESDRFSIGGSPMTNSSRLFIRPRRQPPPISLFSSQDRSVDEIANDAAAFAESAFVSDSINGSPSDSGSPNTVSAPPDLIQGTEISTPSRCHTTQ